MSSSYGTDHPNPVVNRANSANDVRNKTQFFSRDSTKKRLILVGADLLAYLISILDGWSVSVLLRQDYSHDYSLVTLFFLFGFPIILLVALSEHHGHYSRFKGFWEEYGEYIKSVAIVAGTTTTYIVVTKLDVSRAWLISTWVSVLVFVPIARIIAKEIMIDKGQWFTPTVIIGSGDNALETALAIESNRYMGFKVQALLDLNQKAQDEEELEITDFLSGKKRRFKKIRPTGSVPALLEEMKFPYVVFALEYDEYIRYRDAVNRIIASRNNLSLIPPLKGLPLFGSEIAPVFRHDVMLVQIRNNLARATPRAVKRMFDIVGATLLLFLLSPILLFIWYTVRSDGGGALYSQERVGEGGKRFDCLKFRSMIENADNRLSEILANDPVLRDEWENDHKLKNDPRITEIGKFLRKTSLDELPQLWNVLKGEMSLVGPRPIVEEEVEKYGAGYRYYSETRPGLTGLWQISGRNDVTYSSRVNLDSWYVRNWSLWLDVTILAKTLNIVLGRKGAY